MGGIRGNYCQFCDRRVADCSCFNSTPAAPVQASTGREQLTAELNEASQNGYPGCAKIAKALATPISVAARELDVEAERRAPVTDPVRSIITGVREFYLGLLSSHLPPDAFDQARADDMTQVAYQGVADRFLALVTSVAAQGTQPESAPVSTEQARDAPKKELAHGHREDFYLMANARRIGLMPIRRVEGMTNWILAHELFATGSNSAHQICVDAGIDPAGYTVERAPSPNNSPVGAKEST